MPRKLERALAVVGCLLLALSFGGWLLAKVSNRRAIAGMEARFAALKVAVHDPDQSDWSDSRIRDYRESLKQTAGAHLGILRIPEVDLEVAVLAGTDDWTLNRGVGWIPGTARLEAQGNVAIAGHRDGFFRALKDIQPGNRIEVATRVGIRSYVVQKTWIVSPEDVEVLEPTGASAITLVTCYPFYYVGPAPKRFIVRGLEVGTGVRNEVL